MKKNVQDKMPEWLYLENALAGYSGVMHNRKPRFVATISLTDQNDDIHLKWIEDNDLSKKELSDLLGSAGEFLVDNDSEMEEVRKNY